MACGTIHTMARSNFHRVFSCGNGGSFALGHGNRESLSAFRLVEALEGLRIKKIACGMNHSGLVTEEGRVLLWGITGDVSFSKEMKEKCLLKKPTKIARFYQEKMGQMQKNGDVVIEDIKLGENFTLALSNKGVVYSWGINEYGQLGQGHDQSIGDPASVSGLSKVVQIECGLKHCIALTKDYQLFGWGSNVMGELGEQTDEMCAPLPVHITAFAEARPFKVSCGS